MKVRVYPAGDDASAYYRLLLPMKTLASHGYDIQRGVVGETSLDVDVVVIQRPAGPETINVIRILQANGIAVMIDIDDNFDSLAPNHPGYSLYQGVKDYVHQACEMANLVTCTTPALVERYGYGHGFCVSNYIPESMLGVVPKQAHDRIWVGWAGSVRVHPNDLQVTRGAVGEVLSAGVEFAHVGDPTGVAKALKVRKPILISRSMSLEEYERAYACFDIAIVPLEQSEFNDAKSWLKGLQAAALGVPFVASPAADYRKLADLGAGLIAHTTKEWKKHLTRLIRQPRYRMDMAIQGRVVARQLTIEANWDKWAYAYQLAADSRSGGPVESASREAVTI